MVVGDADTPVNFESQRLTEDGATVDSSHGSRHGYVLRRWPGFSRLSIRRHTGILSISAEMFTINFFVWSGIFGRGHGVDGDPRNLRVGVVLDGLRRWLSHWCDSVTLFLVVGDVSKQ